MRITTAIVSMVALSAGVLGGSAAYQLASAGGGPEPFVAATTAPVEEAPAPVVRGTRFGWEPCEAPAVLKGKACVTEVVRTVVVPAPAPAPAPAAVVPPEAPIAYVDDDGGSDDEDGAYDDDDDSYGEDEDDGDDDSHDEDESHEDEDD